MQSRTIYLVMAPRRQRSAVTMPAPRAPIHGLSSWDELWGYTSESSRRLWEALTPVPTRKNSIRFISTYAGFEGESGLLWDYTSSRDAVLDIIGTATPGTFRPALQIYAGAKSLIDHSVGGEAMEMIGATNGRCGSTSPTHSRSSFPIYSRLSETTMI